MSRKLWKDAVQAIVNAGKIPIPISDTLYELIKLIINEEQASFITIFDRSLNIDEIKEKSGLSDDKIDELLKGLMHEGAVICTPNRNGVKVYKLLGPFPGLFEFTMMRGETGEKQKQLSKLFEKLFLEIADFVQGGYDNIVPLMKNFPPVDRVVSIGKTLNKDKDAVLPFEEAEKIVDKFDIIALTHCYCRHEKDLLDKKCKVTNERENCLMFGKIAKFAIDQNFAKPIEKEEAKKVLAKAREDGLVHKAFHVNLDHERDEEAICNCCKCCCGSFHLFNIGAIPFHSFSSYSAMVEQGNCTSCGICEDVCPMDAIEIKNFAEVNEEKCIGCGVCAYNCPQDTIVMKDVGSRKVFVPPAKRK